jgi:hypothetical protein
LSALPCLPSIVVSTWFTVRLADRPGSLARLSGALAERGVNISGIVGVAEDTDGTLMLTTSDPAATREALGALGIDFAAHEAGEAEAGALSDVRSGLSARGLDLGER